MDAISPEQFGTTIKITQDAALHKRMSDAFEATRDQMAMNLYGGPAVPKKLSWAESRLRRVRVYSTRIQNAWLVLIGRADIYDGY